MQRATIAIVASLLALGCVVFVEHQTAEEIVAVDAMKAPAVKPPKEPKWSDVCAVKVSTRAAHRVMGQCRAYKRFCRLTSKLSKKHPDIDLSGMAKRHCTMMMHKHNALVKHRLKHAIKKHSKKVNLAISHTMRRNLRDFKAFCDVSIDNIIEVSTGAGQTNVVLNSLAKSLERVPANKPQNVAVAYVKWLQGILKKYPDKASLARNMALRIHHMLGTNHGLLTVDGKNVKFTGKTMGLQGTPHNWKKYMHAKLKKVLQKAASYSRHIEVIKKKATSDAITPEESKILWGSKCIEADAYGKGFSMGCGNQLTKKQCKTGPSATFCAWRVGWEGK